MNLLAPLALGLLAIIPPSIVIMYLLKLKRTPQVVPSTLLWRRSVRDMVANAPFQKLRNNLLLWLQLLIALILILALARPVARMAGLGGSTIIVLLDLSGSMQARNADGQTRLEQAQELALQAIEEMRTPNPLLGGFTARDEMMIIGVADKTVPLQTLTSDQGALRSAVLGAQATDTEINLEDAALILEERVLRRNADGMVEPDPNTRVILISDGRLGPTAEALVDFTTLEFVQVGDESANVGFTGVELRENFSGFFEYQLFATLYNSGDEEREVFIELDINGEVLDLKSTTLPPRSSEAVVFIVGEGATGMATLRLVDHTDPLAQDDVARLNVAPPTDLRVQFVSDGNAFLERVLSVDPRVRLEQVPPGQYTGQEGYDITVFEGVDGAVMGEQLPPGSYVFINSPPPLSTGFTIEPEPIDRPEVIDWNRVHPLTRYTVFDEVKIGEAFRITTPEDGTPLVQALETDLVTLRETDAQRFLVIGFDINRSYWPLDPSFPIFFSNLVDYWARTARGANRPAYATGTIIPIIPPREAAGLTVRTPERETQAFDLTGQTTIYLTDTAHAGVYDLQYEGEAQPRALPVNMASLLESDIAPDDELELGGRTVGASADATRTRQELWPWFALLALGVLLAEWAVYCRRRFM